MHGPLHRTLVKAIAAGDEFVWFEHDVARYRGERVHVEFTAADGGDFAVAMVAQGERPPELVNGPGESLSALLDAETPDALAAGYQRLVVDAQQALSDGKLNDAPDLARVADRLVRTPALLNAKPVDAVEKFATEQTALLAEARRHSRLSPAMWDGNGVDERVFVRGNPTPWRGRPAAVPRGARRQRGAHRIRRSGRLELARASPIRPAIRSSRG